MKPKILKEEHLVYLDELRISGVTNMYGAGSYLEAHYPLSTKEASEILSYWMETFSDRHKED